MLLHKQGHYEDAARLYQEAINEKGEFAEAFLNLGHAMMSQGNEAEAKSCWKLALEAKPELATGYF